MSKPIAIPSVSVTYAQDGTSTSANALGMRPMQERAYQKRGEQYLLIKSPPASGKSRALMFIALDKLKNQKLKQAIINEFTAVFVWIHSTQHLKPRTQLHKLWLTDLKTTANLKSQI
jgi:hypothetical protein